MKKPISLIIMFFMVILNIGCGSVRGSGNVVVEDRDVAGFSRVVMSGRGRVILTQGEDESLFIEAEDNIIPLIKTTVSNDTLFINGDALGNAVPKEPVKIHLTMRDIQAIEISGISYVDAEQITVDQLEITGRTGGKINIESLIANDIIVHLDEDSSVEVKGVVETQVLDIVGHSDYRAAGLQSQTVTVSVGDIGTATIWAEDEISGVVDGNGDVLYYGSAETNLTVSDSGKVKQRDK